MQAVKQVHIWGFPNAAEDELPKSVDPVRMSGVSWPTDAPVVVHAAALAEFERAAVEHPLPDGSMPTAILYLPDDAQEPADAWVYFDAVVREGDWIALEDLLECPRQFGMATLAGDIPARFLDRLRIPAADVPVQDWPLLIEDLGHLATCGLCRVAFDDAVERRRASRLVAGLAYAPAPVRRRPWLSVALVPDAAERIVRELDRLGRRAGAAVDRAIAAVAGGLAGGGLDATPALVRGQQRSTAASETASPADLYTTLSNGGELALAALHRDLSVSHDAQRAVLRFEGLRGERGARVRRFRVLVLRGEDELWSSAASGGVAEIPLAELEAAIAAGADQLIIDVDEDEVVQ